MKTSCCNDSYLGIQEKHFKSAIAERFLQNGARIPCLSCRTLYQIENYSLVRIGSIPIEEANFLLKMTTEQLIKRLMGITEEVKKEESNDSLFMKNLNVKW